MERHFEKSCKEEKKQVNEYSRFEIYLMRKIILLISQIIFQSACYYWMWVTLRGGWRFEVGDASRWVTLTLPFFGEEINPASS